MSAPSAAWNAIASTVAAERYRRALLYMRNVCAGAEGASVTVTDSDGSGNYPAAGIIDNELHHLNYGAAGSADDGIGLRGWKSAASSDTRPITTAANWNGGTRVDTLDSGNAIELSLGTSAYEQDFDDLNVATLAGQDSWTDVAGAGTMAVSVASDYGNGTNGLNINCGAGANRTMQRLVTFNATTVAASWRMKCVSAGSAAGGSYAYLSFYDTAGNIRFVIRMVEDGAAAAIIGYWNGAAWSELDARILPGTAWCRFYVHMDRTDAANTVINVYLAVGTSTSSTAAIQHVLSTTQSTVAIDAIRIVSASGAGGASQWYMDEIRIGGGTVPTSGTVINTLDWSAGCPVGKTTTFAINGEANEYYKQIAGAKYSANNQDTHVALRDAAARTAIAQTFTPTEDGLLTGVLIGAYKVGAPVQAGYWVELRATTAGAPNATILARGRTQPVADLATGTGPTYALHVFPRPYRLTSGTVYALVVNGDEVIGAAYVAIKADSSAPSYAGGSVYAYDGANWNASAGVDLCFTCMTSLQDEELYSETNQDTDGKLGYDATYQSFYQGVKWARSVAFRHVSVYLRQHAGASFAAGDRIWVEIQSDDGTGKPSNTILATSCKYDPALVGTSYGLFCFTFPTDFTPTAAMQYHLVLKSTKTSTTNYVDVGYDASAPGYTGGACGTGTSASVWSAVAGDLCFHILSTIKPSYTMDIAYSTDDVTYGSYSAVTANPAQAGSLSTFTVTTEQKRYWKVRVNMFRQTTNGIAANWTPAVMDYTPTVLFDTAKNAIIAFGASKVISRAEIYTHPTYGGCRLFILSTSTNGVDYTDITSIDTTVSVAKKKNGTASVTYDSTTHEIWTDGDVVCVNFTDTTATHLKVSIRDNIVAYAVLLEVRAMRILDITSRLGPNLSITQDSDYLLRKVGARSMSVTLDNHDGYLSPKGSLGGFNSDLRNMLVIELWTGYKDLLASGSVYQGAFYVDKWTEGSDTAEINVSARDKTKLLNIPVTPAIKTNIRADVAVEYFYNLAGLHSADLQMDALANIITYLAEDNPNAYETIQKIVAAGGFGVAKFTRNGDFTVTGCAQTMSRIAAPSCIFNFQKHGDYIYYCNGSSILKKVALETFASSDCAGGVSSGGTNGGIVMEYDGRLWLLSSMAHGAHPTETSYPRLDVYDYSTDAFTHCTTMQNFMGADIYLDLIAWSEYAYITRAELMDGHLLLLYVSHTDLVAPPNTTTHGVVHTFDLMTYEWTRYEVGTLTLTASAINYRTMCSAPDGRWFLCAAGADYAHNNFCEWTPYTTTITVRVAIPVFVTGSITSGLRVNDDSTYAYLTAFSNNFPNGSQCRAVMKINLSTWAMETLYFSDDNTAISSRFHVPPDGMGLIGGVLVCGIPQEAITNYNTDMGMMDLKTGRLSSATAMKAEMRIGFAYEFSWGNGDYICFRGYEVMYIFQVRKEIVTQSSSLYTIQATPGGTLGKYTIEHGEEAGGKSRIINHVIIRSEPYVEFTAQKVWQAGNLSWDFSGRDPYPFDAILKDPAANVAATLVGVGVATVNAHPRKVHVSVAGGGAITNFYLTGNPLVKGGAIQVEVMDALSMCRWGRKSFTYDNDYMMDTFTMDAAGMWVLIRSAYPASVIEGLNTLALDYLDVQDRVTVVDTRTGLNEDFYVVGFATDFGQGESRLSLAQVEMD